MRAAFVYPNSRREMLAERRGRQPGYDSQLHGCDVPPRSTASRSCTTTRCSRGGSCRGRSGRRRGISASATIPFELRGIDVVFTPLGAAGLPLAARLRGLPGRRHELRAEPDLAASVVGAAAPASRVARSGGANRLLRRVADDGARRADRTSGGARRDATAADRRPLLLARSRRRRTSTLASLTVGKDLARDYATVARGGRPLDVDVDFVTMPRNLEGDPAPGERRRAARRSFGGAPRPVHACGRRRRRAAARRVRVRLRRRRPDDVARGNVDAAARRRDGARDLPRLRRRRRRGSRRAGGGSRGDACRDRAPARATRSCAPGSALRAARVSSATTPHAASRRSLRRSSATSSTLGRREHVRRRLPVPRALLEPLPTRPAGEVPRLGARRRRGRWRTRCC